jgi:integrase
MTWDEISQDGKTWTIPGTRTKNGKTHVVPLSRQMRELVAARPRLADNPHVFAGAKKGQSYRGFTQSKEALSRESSVANWVLHDLRRTFCDTAR